MRDDELKAKLPAAVDKRLSALEGDPWLARRIIQAERGDRPIVKKKLSVSFALILVLMLLTLSAAVALVNSSIAGQLFGSQEQAPEAVLEAIHTPQVTASAELGTLTMDEWLYDGNGLHTAFTMSNPTGEPLLYTLDGIWLNGQRITYNHFRTDGAGDSGFLLGGTVDGVAMPTSQSLYNLGEELYQFDENGKFAGTVPLPEGENKLKVSVAVWKPTSPVELVDYDQYEGYDVTQTKDHLTVDDSGFANLWLFRPGEYNLSTNALQIPSAVYAQAYKELGWMELADTIDVEIDVNLTKADMVRAMPKQMEVQVGECRLVFTEFDMTQSGGVIDGWVYGEVNAVNTLMEGGLHVLDASGTLLSSGCWWDDQDEGVEGMHFHINLAPMAGELPGSIQLASMKDIEVYEGVVTLELERK
ncbi:MAG: hypothetical protein IJX84_00180 [Clostridia bacterium]|nr:hypothetical protein [Clostridia bacterium]